jgi:hypothetical protein
MRNHTSLTKHGDLKAREVHISRRNALIDDQIDFLVGTGSCGDSQPSHLEFVWTAA